MYLKFVEEKALPRHSPIALASFMMNCVEQGMSRNTVCSTIPAAVSHLFLYSLDKPITENVLVQEARKAAARATPPPGDGRKPLTVAILQKLAHLVGDRLEEVRDFFLILLMFFALLRGGEAVSLNLCRARGRFS